jgi:SAM-dependent methyltransferase
MKENLNFTNNYSLYYDLLYKEKEYKKEANYIESLIKEFSPSTTSLIELGSGTGNHAKFLCDCGFSVVGLERSPEMVSISNDKNIVGFKAITANIIDFNLLHTFDAAISLFHVISYLNLNKDLVSCFNNVHKHLKNNGIFIFDVWFTPAVYSQGTDTRIKRINDSSIEIIRIAESTSNTSNNVVDVQFDIIIKSNKTDLQEVYREHHFMRHFSIPEIELLASQSGFHILKVEEFMTGNQPSTNTWGVCFILKKFDNE